MFLHLSMILFMGGCLADTPLGRYPPRQTPHPTPIQEMATAVDGTHPTEMHSCYNLFFKNYLMINYQATRNLLGHHDLQSWVPDWATTKKFLNHRLHNLFFKRDHNTDQVFQVSWQHFYNCQSNKNSGRFNIVPLHLWILCHINMYLWYLFANMQFLSTHPHSPCFPWAFHPYTLDRIAFIWLAHLHHWLRHT